MRQLFFYGTLRDLGLLAAVLGRPVTPGDIRAARLPDFEVCAVKDQDFPFARPAKGAESPGILVRNLTETEIERLNYYEGAYLYGLSPHPVRVDGATETAEVYISDHSGWIPDGLWSLERWMAWDHGVTAEAAIEAMSYFGQRPTAEVHARFAAIRLRAQSRLNARSGAPVAIRRGFGRADIQQGTVRRPYMKFFALEEHDLRFRRFDGGMSDEIERAVFIGADAVTVLPYDPVSDQVLLIEQFRAGPHARGDSHPWCLEPVAGRLDLHETAPQAAMREMQEETGLTLSALEQIGAYYTSPGAYSEYLTSYIGILPLQAGFDSIAGLEAEHEDIRSVTLSFGDLMASLESGEADNGPLWISALWLQANRDRLRAKYAGA